MKLFLATLSCGLLLTACGGSAKTTSSAAGQTDTPGTTDAQWTELLSGDWSLGAGQETYKCVKKTIDQDLYIHGFRAISPLGTHHTVLAVGAPNGPDGIAGCSSNGFDLNMIFGSGVGTHDVVFPDGLALHLSAGQQLVSNLHLFNTTNDTLTGTSGNDALLTTLDQTTDLVDNMLAGPVFFNIPPNQTTVVTGDCTMDADVNIIAVQPHMHKLGTHQTVVAKTAAGGDIVMHDADYSFDDQVYYLATPQIAMQKGDKIHVECTFDNETNSAVTFGESTNNEMCFTSVYRYPASGAPHSVCSN